VGAALLFAIAIFPKPLARRKLQAVLVGVPETEG
jgi:hypothetical protein